MQEKLLRLPQVLEIVPVCKSSWWAGIKAGKYPRGKKLGAKTTVWLESEITALIATLTTDGKI
ncbi:MAG: AlpA family phage regulatory protein [Geobacter sp.]|nr:MAG: AlpA family phage regulatory protein [Geobacter sp.]